LLVELEEYGTCNMIFLVAGHTKNAADCLFNLLKKEYRQNNIYNMSMLIDKLNHH
jgi:folylpolyglutamate synthase/dihydropteroate synthase